MIEKDTKPYLDDGQNKKTEQEILKRSIEITQNYFQSLDKHIAEVVSGAVDQFMEINQIANELFISHQHLTDTVQKETGNHPCYFYDLNILDEAKKMLLQTGKSIAEIAKILTYDPSNFSKFFKKFVGQPPGQSFNRNVWNDCRCHIGPDLQLFTPHRP